MSNFMCIPLLLLSALGLTASGERAVAQSPKQPEFAAVDVDGDRRIGEREARQAGLMRLVSSWQQVDEDQSGWIQPDEYEAFMAGPGGTVAAGALGKPTMTIGAGRFEFPETVLWDEQADIYLVSNVNGGLTAVDDNGFISRVTPDGRIEKLKWIDGGQQGVTLSAPTGMLFWRDLLVVADVKTLRFFDRATGEPVRQTVIDGAHLLNDLALSDDGRALYVSDTGSALFGAPGAIYSVAEGREPVVVARGPELGRPNGLVWHDGGVLVAPFDSEADTLYHVSADGRSERFAEVPRSQLDGLLELPDGSFAVTSWGGNAIYRVTGRGAEATLWVDGVEEPAQIGYDRKRKRLLVPVVATNEVRIYSDS